MNLTSLARRATVSIRAIRCLAWRVFLVVAHGALAAVPDLLLPNVLPAKVEPRHHLLSEKFDGVRVLGGQIEGHAGWR
jgi:hypothetical protein